jgi:peptidoglycan/xylan/chitin deacetylase (PgdA/CDA1 family)
MSGMRAATLLLGAGVAWTAPALAPVVPAVAAALGVPRRHAGPEPLLTFDDGPHPQGTPAVLDRLERSGRAAVFFLVGEQVRRDRGLAGEIAARGHEIAVHGDRHRNLLRVPPSAFAGDLDRACATIADATGVAPARYRPPYGIFSAVTLPVVRARNLDPLLWTHWGRDWSRRQTPAGIARLVLDGLGPGDVVLLHDSDAYSDRGSWRATVAALDLILPAL